MAITLARKDSKGLPGKNYKSLAGKPVFLWSVEAASKSKYVDYNVVNSCCPSVKKYFLQYKATNNDESLYFIDRPEELNGDLVKNEDVLIQSVNHLGLDVDIVVCLQASSPIRYNNLLDRCLEKMMDDKADSLLTVSKTSPFFWYQDDNQDSAHCPNLYYYDRPMRQEMKSKDFALFDNGNIYITDKNILFSDNNRLGGKITTYKTDKYQSLQIDDLNDFLLIGNVCRIIGNMV